MDAIRISVDEVNTRMDAGEDFFFVDSRNPKAWAEAETKLPQAIRAPADDVEKHFADIPHDRPIVVYCT